MDAASYPTVARNAYVSPFPFEPSNGGRGINMAASSSSGTSSRTALVGSGHTMRIVSTNGTADAHLALGDSSVEATTSDMAIKAGTEIVLTVPGGRDATTPTHAAVITVSGTVNIQITRGYGV